MAIFLPSVFSCFVLCCVFLVVNASLSGLYIDNGLDQTIIQRGMTRRERMLVEHEILDLLGLPSRPLKTRNVPLNKSAPIFLLDVYKSLEDERDIRPTRSSEVMFSGEDLQAIDQSDVIMTFQSKNHHGAALRHEKGRRLWFDVSEAPVGESIFNAELRLFQYANNTYDSEEIFTISAHKIVSVGNQGNLELELISSTNTTASYDGWIEINITDVFTDWVAFPNDNNGLYLQVHPHSRPGHEIRPDEIGIVSMKGEDDKQPFMVAYLKASVNLNEKVVSRKKREARKHKKNHIQESYAPRNPITDTHQRQSRICKIQTLYVSFKDLEWQDWIIAPDGYGAFYCSGECNFPLNAHMNATNHAIVQTLVHLLRPNEVPKPCCAPTKLTPISVLYFLDESNVILKKYRNMVVKSCGCH